MNGFGIILWRFVAKEHWHTNVLLGYVPLATSASKEEKNKALGMPLGNGQACSHSCRIRKTLTSGRTPAERYYEPKVTAVHSQSTPQAS